MPLQKLKTLNKLIKSKPERIPYALFLNFRKTGIFNGLSDRSYLMLMYRLATGKKLNIDSPQTFNEKLQWLKIHDRDPIYIKMVDKYEAKKYVAKIIGSEYIIPTYGLWDTFEEIDFEKLPNQFVLKCTHDSGSSIICKDKGHFDFSMAKKKLEKCLNHNMYWYGREWPYKHVIPHIIAEKYMEDTDTGELRDYKFFCFDGVARFFKVDFDRFIEHRANYYDLKGNLLKFGEADYPPDYNKEIKLPRTLNIMRNLAEMLSEGHPFLRVDFYDVNGKVYFGEITFYPTSGMERFVPEEYDKVLGELINLC